MKNFARRINKTFYYGWIIVIVSALSYIFSSPGQTFSISVFINIYETSLGYSKTLLSTGYSIATILSGCLLIFMGKAIDKFGQRRMLIIASVMLALSTFFNSIISSIWMIFIGFFILRFFGQGSLTLIPNTLVPQWFEKKRGFAISLSSYGHLIGTLVVPAVNLWLISKLDWQNTWRLWGIAILVFLVPLIFLFVINRPEDVEIPMENEKENKDISVALSLEKLERESWSLKEALRTKQFWKLGIISLIIPMFTTGVTFHFFSMLNYRNVNNETAAWIIGLVALPSILMPVLSKLFIDRYKEKYIIFLTQFMILLSMLFFLFFVTNAFTAVVFILFYGLAVSIQGIAYNIIWPSYYGRKYLGSVRGAAIVFMVIGSALGPLPFGVVYDLIGSYDPVIIGMIIMTIMTMTIALTINKPHKSVNS